MRILWSFIWMLLPASTVVAQIYKSTDEQGQTVYSDQPTSNSKPVTLPPLQTFSPLVPLTPPTPSASTMTAEEEIPAYVVHILNPPDGSYPEMGSQWFFIEADVNPLLKEEHFLRLWHNGNYEGFHQKEAQFKIEWLPRGTHEFKIGVVTSNDEVLTESNLIQIYQRRPTVPRPKQ